MDKELKAKWVAALRSGEYKQCSGKLYDGVGYCCIGVLLKLDGVTEEWMATHTMVLHRAKNGPGDLLPMDDKQKLADMNDGLNGDLKRYTFAEIADYIEANL
jgi:hypothetical protein